MPIKVRKFTKCIKFDKNTDITSPSVLEIDKILLKALILQINNV